MLMVFIMTPAMNKSWNYTDHLEHLNVILAEKQQTVSILLMGQVYVLVVDLLDLALCYLVKCYPKIPLERLKKKQKKAIYSLYSVHHSQSHLQICSQCLQKNKVLNLSLSTVNQPSSILLQI